MQQLIFGPDFDGYRGPYVVGTKDVEDDNGFMPAVRGDWHAASLISEEFAIDVMCCHVDIACFFV